MAYEPVLTRYFDDNPAPRVEVFFPSLATGTASVTVYRLAEGREFPVRGAIRASTAGQFTRMDHEVPFGVTVIYRAEMFNSAGVSLGYSGTASTVFDVRRTWVHNPLDPSGAVEVAVEKSSAKKLSRPFVGDVVYPQGRQVGVLLVSGRQALSATSLTCITLTDEDANKFAALFGTYSAETIPALCVRLSASMKMRLPRPFYAGILDVSEEEFDLYNGGSTVSWELKASEVSPPAPGLFISLLTRADVNAFYAARADVDAYNLTRLDVARNFGIADGSAPALGTVEAPAGSGLYTLGSAEQAPQSGMYLTDGFTESPVGSGLYTMGGAL
jgi:hypothetical protein